MIMNDEGEDEDAKIQAVSLESPKMMEQDKVKVSSFTTSAQESAFYSRNETNPQALTRKIKEIAENKRLHKYE
jgi:hypothetical protein